MRSPLGWYNLYYANYLTKRELHECSEVAWDTCRKIEENYEYVEGKLYYRKKDNFKIVVDDGICKYSLQKPLLKYYIVVVYIS